MVKQVSIEQQWISNEMLKRGKKNKWKERTYNCSIILSAIRHTQKGRLSFVINSSLLDFFVFQFFPFCWILFYYLLQYIYIYIYMWEREKEEGNCVWQNICRKREKRKIYVWWFVYCADAFRLLGFVWIQKNFYQIFFCMRNNYNR